jgi:hypothetical protein
MALKKEQLLLKVNSINVDYEAANGAVHAARSSVWLAKAAAVNRRWRMPLRASCVHLP